MVPLVRPWAPLANRVTRDGAGPWALPGRWGHEEDQGRWLGVLVAAPGASGAAAPGPPRWAARVGPHRGEPRRAGAGPAGCGRRGGSAGPRRGRGRRGWPPVPRAGLGWRTAFMGTLGAPWVSGGRRAWRRWGPGRDRRARNPPRARSGLRTITARMVRITSVLALVVVVVAQEVAEDGDAADAPDALEALGLLLLEQAAEDRGLAVPQPGRGLDDPLAQVGPARGRRRPAGS